MPLRFPLHLRLSRDEGITWSEPILLADRPTKTPGWSICYPTLTEIPDGTVLAIWAQVKSTSTVLYGDIHSARLKLSVAGARCCPLYPFDPADHPSRVERLCLRCIGR